MKRNEAFLKTAESLKPELNRRTVRANPHGDALREGESILFDFREHLVGYVTLSLAFEGSHPDAPAWIELQFAERKQEFSEDAQSYNGWVSKSWIQQERIHVDTFPSIVKLPRRYAFRYLKLIVLGISSKYRLKVEEAQCEAVSSANDADLKLYQTRDRELSTIDRIACRTLHDCMQDVFEDGPKRDRRLWLGDLRLQALANTQTYRRFDLVRRCLYLFAGSTFESGQISAAIFTEPEIEADDTAMFDYSLLFVPTLLDYYEATGDRDTLSDLWPTAYRQIELAEASFDASGLVCDSDRLGWCFTDWNLQLNKQTSAQGTYLYCLKAAKQIAETLEDTKLAAQIEADYAQKRDAALRYLFDAKKGVFVSGKDRQVSVASQVWMILGGVSDDAQILFRAKDTDGVIGMVTPYMYHHYVQALIDTGRREDALNTLRAYWGGMANEGADTFWELYNPENANESPYGGTIVLSYCHAWSCAPAYFLRKYYTE